MFMGRWTMWLSLRSRVVSRARTWVSGCSEESEHGNQGGQQSIRMVSRVRTWAFKWSESQNQIIMVETESEAEYQGGQPSQNLDIWLFITVKTQILESQLGYSSGIESRVNGVNWVNRAVSLEVEYHRMLNRIRTWISGWSIESEHLQKVISCFFRTKKLLHCPWEGKYTSFWSITQKTSTGAYCFFFTWNGASGRSVRWRALRMSRTRSEFPISCKKRRQSSADSILRKKNPTSYSYFLLS